MQQSLFGQPPDMLLQNPISTNHPVLLGCSPTVGVRGETKMLVNLLSSGDVDSSPEDFWISIRRHDHAVRKTTVSLGHVAGRQINNESSTDLQDRSGISITVIWCHFCPRCAADLGRLNSLANMYQMLPHTVLRAFRQHQGSSYKLGSVWVMIQITGNVRQVEWGGDVCQRNFQTLADRACLGGTVQSESNYNKYSSRRRQFTYRPSKCLDAKSRLSGPLSI